MEFSGFNGGSHCVTCCCTTLAAPSLLTTFPDTIDNGTDISTDIWFTTSNPTNIRKVELDGTDLDIATFVFLFTKIPANRRIKEILSPCPSKKMPWIGFQLMKELQFL